MKYYIIAGEASGDLHASNLIKELHKRDAQADVRCWGGDLMEKAGATLVKHYRDLAFMGFVEVLKNLRTILGNISFCKKDITTFAPDVLVLVDYPGFNMRIAKWAKQQGIKVVYYISPQIWAWKQSRVHALKRDVDRMLCILPFEVDFYKKFNWEVDFVGHPLLDAIAQREPVKALAGVPNNKPLVALLPGSRSQEISVMLPVFKSVASKFPQYTFVVAGAPAREAAFYEPYIKDSDLKLVLGQTYDLLHNADFALVTSGTATLETALFEVPEVVCYKGSAISYAIARQLIKVKFISLVNLVMDREVVKELIQGEFTVAHVGDELKKLSLSERKKQMNKDYASLKEKLGGIGASAKAAQIIYETAQ